MSNKLGADNQEEIGHSDGATGGLLWSQQEFQRVIEIILQRDRGNVQHKEGVIERDAFHGILQWFGLGEPSEIIWFPPPATGQGHKIIFA